MLAPFEQCTGCMACFNACQYGAIQVNIDREGFERPSVLESLCVKCDQCEAACPVMNPFSKERNDHLQVYAGVHVDEHVLRHSSSGGVFSALAQHILFSQGIVCGAAFSDRLMVEHELVEREEDLFKLCQSKYVQSSIGQSFTSVKKNLERGRLVLFSGLPCQVAGLYSFLGKDYDNLYTVDIFCKGAPSPGVFKTFIRSVERHFKSEVHSISFREKKHGWEKAVSVIFLKNGREYRKRLTQTSFGSGFSSGLFLRPSCYHCRYRNRERYGDISLGDFWSIGRQSKFFKDKSKGVSLVILNSRKGKLLFELIAGVGISFEELDVEDSLEGNLALQGRINPNWFRTAFFAIFSVHPALALNLFTWSRRNLVWIRDQILSIAKRN